MARWNTHLLDEAALAQMPRLPAAEVTRHADHVISQHPKPQQLYQRWETQQWSAEAVELGPDRDAFDGELPAAVRRGVREAICTFIVGEYTGLDLLPAIVAGSPDEDGLLYLGTQLADEARHTRLMFRLGSEVLGFDSDPGRQLDQAWAACSPSHQALSQMEARCMTELARRPLDYATWLRAVTLFHLITEGMLALVGQRSLVHSLRAVTALPGVRTSFTAMCRDESRHVSYGLHALRQGVQAGYADDICDVIEEAAPLADQIEQETSRGRRTGVSTLGEQSLRRHLGHLGLPDALSDDLLRRVRADRQGSHSAGASAEERR